jgi:hypothetical protein
MPLEEFETTIHAGKWPHTCPLDRAATRIGTKNRPIRKFILQSSQVRKRGSFFEPVLIIHTHLSPNLTPIFYLLLFTSVAETVYRWKNIWGRAFPILLPPKLRPCFQRSIFAISPGFM